RRTLAAAVRSENPRVHIWRSHRQEQNVFLCEFPVAADLADHHQYEYGLHPAGTWRVTALYRSVFAHLRTGTGLRRAVLQRRGWKQQCDSRQKWKSITER